jgi:anaerobic selenocysteine-containing dehydrogenase
VRNYARYSPPLFARPAGHPPDWEVVLRLAGIVMGQGPDANIEALDEFVARQQVEGAVGAAGSLVAGRDPAEIMSTLASRRGPERLLDLLLRSGPYGDGFGTRPDGLSLAALEAAPHGVDLGALEPRIPEVLRTPSGMIELAPEPLVADVARLRARLERSQRELLLVGRRDLRSNNSWMHNVENLVRGRERCTLQLHPDDAASLGLADGDRARVRSRAGSIDVPVEITAGIMRGVASVPHGWGHDAPGIRLGVAAAHAGVNCNLLADEAAIDPLSGNAVLNGTPITIEQAG